MRERMFAFKSYPGHWVTNTENKICVEKEKGLYEDWEMGVGGSRD